MKRVLVVATLVLITACGSSESDVTSADPTALEEPTAMAESTTAVEPTSSPVPAVPTATPDAVRPTAPPANAGQREELELARVKWRTTRPDSYELLYTLECECDEGPFEVRVEGTTTIRAENLFGFGADPPYRVVEEIFDDIQTGLDAGESTVEVDYDETFGYPVVYTFNAPGLPVDAGFVLRVQDFVVDPLLAEAETRRELQQARDRWSNAGPIDYDHRISRLCFCLSEFVGPHEVSVRDGRVVAATYEGVDLIDLLDITRYSELVLSVEQVFDEVERAIVEGAELQVSYHPTLGHPTEVAIDWVGFVADDEVTYLIEDLRPAPDGCSAAGLAVDLVPQPELPGPVAAIRQGIFDAAIACDLDRLVGLTSPDGFTASFGGGGPADLWRDLEAQGVGVLGDLALVLNLAFTEPGTADSFGIYSWPSAFHELEAPDGTGLPPDEYAQLLAVYSRHELEEMFEAFGGYVGYRTGITTEGEWVFFVAGD